MKLDKESNSQSCTFLEKRISQWRIPFGKDIISSTEGSLSPEIANNSGKAPFKDLSPHQQSCQNLTLFPSPTTKAQCWKKLSQPRLINFQTLTPYGPLPNSEHQPPHKLPYFASTTNLHKASLSEPYRHNHFPRRAVLKLLKSRMANPPL